MDLRRLPSRKRRCDVIFAAMAMLALAAIALPLAISGLAKSGTDTVDEDATTTSPSTVSEKS
jgi:hypothetical protein